MKYREYENYQQSIKERIRKEEERHFNLSIDLRIAEALKDDTKILSLTKQMSDMEVIIEALYEL